MQSIFNTMAYNDKFIKRDLMKKVKIPFFSYLQNTYLMKLQQNNLQNSKQQNKTITQYFSKHSKYERLSLSIKKIQSMIQNGNMKISQRTIFPLYLKDNKTSKSLKIAEQQDSKKYYLKFRQRLQTDQLNLHQKYCTQSIKINTHFTKNLSNLNRRKIESLLRKYKLLEKQLQMRLNDANQLQAFEQNYERKIAEYSTLLVKSKKKLLTTPQEQQFLNKTRQNYRLRQQIEEDQVDLKQYSRKWNCSLYIKDKYYEPLTQIRKKISKMDCHSMALSRMEQTINNKHKHPLPHMQDNDIKCTKEQLDQSSTVKRERAKESEPNRIGKLYLQFSRNKGLQSKQLLKYQRGKIGFVKEVLHHWWLNDN